MAAITIRNLSDEVVEALKKRAKRNGRSMEAEVREALRRLAADDGLGGSGVEEAATRGLGAQPWGRTGAEINAWIEAHPLTEEEKQTAREWAAECAARPYDEDPFRDPWEQADEQLQRMRKEQGR